MDRTDGQTAGHPYPAVAELASKHRDAYWQAIHARDAAGQDRAAEGAEFLAWVLLREALSLLAVPDIEPDDPEALRRALGLLDPERGEPGRGTIYVLASPVMHAVKIGWTRGDVEQRRKALEHAHGDVLDLLVQFPGSQTDERALHDRFAGDRMPRGEWFRRGPAIQRWLAGRDL